MDDRAGMKDSATFEIDGQLASLLNPAAVGYIPASDEAASQINYVPDVEVVQIFVLNRCGQDFFHSITPS